MEKEKKKLDEHEASLEVEEKVLEGIRDSLKGKETFFTVPSIPEAYGCCRQNTGFP